jgi:LysM repeat protein
MNSLREETYALEAELRAARQEAAILDRALTSVYKERDQVVDQIARAQAELSGQTLPENSNTSGTAVLNLTAAGQLPRTYKVQAGDTLSSIAQKFGTTVNVLLGLNPFLNSRSSYMVWVGDSLSLPQR